MANNPLLERAREEFVASGGTLYNTMHDYPPLIRKMREIHQRDIKQLKQELLNRRRLRPADTDSVEQWIRYADGQESEIARLKQQLEDDT